MIKDSRKFLVKKYPKQNRIQIELAKYHIWDMLDNLEEIFESDGREFFFVYYNYLNNLYEVYSKLLRFDSIPVHKLRRFLINGREKKKYHISNFPDGDFVRMYVRALNIENNSKMMKEYKKLTNYVLKKMGGFNIDGWKIKSPV